MSLLDNSTIPFISDQLDDFFAQFGVSFITIIAITGIVLGLFLAFFGAKGQGPKVLGFIAGFLVGAYFGALGLEALDNANDNISAEIWIGVFVASGIFVGLLAACIVSFAKIIIGIATGLVVAGVFFQVGLAELITNEIALIVIVVLLCCAAMYLAVKLIDLIYAILASFLGGSLIALGSGSFTDSPITLNLLTSDPESAVLLCQESEENCYIPLGIGAAITLISLVYNLYGYKKKRKKREKNQAGREQNDELVAQMREDRVGFEEQLRKLQESNQEVLKSVQLAGTQRNDNVVTSFRMEMQKQEQGLQALEAKLEVQEQKDETNAEVIKALQVEKEQLQTKMEEEKALHEIELKQVALGLEEDPEENKSRKAMILEMQQEASEMRLRLTDLESDYKEAAKLEKKMTITVPKRLKKKQFNFFEDDSDYDRELEEVNELKERANEFIKLKAVVSQAKTSQKKTLKVLKKAFKDIDSLNQSLRRLSFKNTGDDLEKALKIKKQKEYATNDLTLKMSILRSLLGKYEESNTTFMELISDTEKKLGEFKEAELTLEAATLIRRENMSMFQDQNNEGEEAAKQRAEDITDLEQGTMDPALIAAGAALERNVASEVSDLESMAEEEMGNEVIGLELALAAEEEDLGPPPPKVWRRNYFETQPRPSNAELNAYLGRYIRAKYPRTLNRLNIFGKKVTAGAAAVGGKIAQKTADYRESRRSVKSMKPDSHNPFAVDEMDVVPSPQTATFQEEELEDKL